MSKYIYELARSLRKKQTPAEKYFWEFVRKRQVSNCLFLRQFVFEYKNVTNKRNYFIGDFYCSQKKLIVEIDGKIHDFQLKYDAEREAILKDMGFTIVRFKNSEVLENIDRVLQDLEKLILNLENRY